MKYALLALFLSSTAVHAGGLPMLLGSRTTPSCTGGTSVLSGLNTIITFNASGTLTCNVPFSAQILVVGGGGGGSGAGGGAGGDCTTMGTPTCGLGSSVMIPSGPVTVTVGLGGTGVAGNSSSPAVNGGNSSLGSIVTATGGGGGGAINAIAINGGSGSGAGPNSTTGAAGGIGSQGNNGGASVGSSTPFPGAGGGGAGAAGSSNIASTTGGAGGNGASNSISGSAVVYAGGGGGGFDIAGTGTAGGAGGTGGGGAGVVTGAGVAGIANTGGGGGGGAQTGLGGAGGSGIVQISCVTSACGGANRPTFVDAACPGLPTSGQCVDFVGNQWWDGTASTTSAATAAFSDTRAGTVPYDPGTSITTTVAANTLPIGSLGLEVFQNNVNYLKSTAGDYTTANWTLSTSNSAAITRTVNPHFGGSGCTAADTAPDGSCNTTEIVVPIPTAPSNAQADIQQQSAVLTALGTYTYWIWVKNSAATAAPQMYISIQEGATPFNEIGRTLVQATSTWQRFAVTFTLPGGFTTVYPDIGICTAPSVACNQGQLGGGTMELWVSGLTPGSAPGPYVPTTSAAATTIALDNITATGDLATALATSNGALSVTTQKAGNGYAATLVDSNGTVLLGKSATDFATTALGATLTSKAQGNFPAVEKSYLAWNGSGGSINLGGTTVVTDATARTSAGPFHIGTTSGTTAPLNGYITSLAVYPSAASPRLAVSAPITGVVVGTVATLSSGTLQGSAPSTYVNGDSWNVSQDASGNTWSLCNDCGWGSTSGGTGGNVILGEQTSWVSGTPGYFNLGNASGGPPGQVDIFNSNLGTFSQGSGGTGIGNTWKTCGIMAIKDGSNTDLFMGLAYDFYAASAPWTQTTSAGSIASVVSTSAATPGSWNGLAPSPAVLPIASPTFPTNQFASPCFVVYNPGYVNSTLPIPNVDNSGTYLYATSNDLAWNKGSNIYLARIPLATILTSLSGSLSAASTAANWTYYNSAGCANGDGTNSSCWGALGSATPIFSLPNALGRSQMTYLPTTNRYLLTSWHYPTTEGSTAGSQTQAQMAATSQFEFIDCDKPWHCNGIVSTADWPNIGYYQPTIVPPSLALDGGFTATAIWAGDFITNLTFGPAATYTPNMGQLNIKY